MPDVGEGLTEAEVVGWLVAPGDTVSVNQVIVEIETAKAVVELPCPYAGTVGELLVEPGRTVEVGIPIITIETAETGAVGTSPGAGDVQLGEAGTGERIATLVGYGPRPDPVVRRSRRGSPGHDQHSGAGSRGERGSGLPAGDPGPTAAALVPLAKPPVRALAHDLGVDLRLLDGTGPDGRITRDDVRTAAAGAQAEPAADAPGEPAVATARPAVAGPAPGSGSRREPIRGVRKATAAAMVSSAFSVPHVTEFLAVDVTATMALRDRLRGSRAFTGVALTPLAFVAKAVCLATRRTPEINASWDGPAGEIVYYDRIQLGIAAATPRGLVVPKIRDADTRDLLGLARALGALTATARAGTTAAGDLVGGTFTITNVGVFGVDTGTPIIYPGEAAILAVGAIKPAPWVVDGELAVRTVCQLALSFDHRLVDGEQGSRFLTDVGALLEDPGVALTW